MMPTDLAAQIRATLDAWANPSTVETTAVLTTEQYDDLVRRFREAQHTGRVEVLRTPFDRMRDALEAVIAAVATPGFVPPNGCGCSACVGGWILAIIAAKLGIEVAA